MAEIIISIEKLKGRLEKLSKVLANKKTASKGELLILYKMLQRNLLINKPLPLVGDGSQILLKLLQEKEGIRF